MRNVLKLAAAFVVGYAFGTDGGLTAWDYFMVWAGIFFAAGWICRDLVAAACGWLKRSPYRIVKQEPQQKPKPLQVVKSKPACNMCQGQTVYLNEHPIPCPQCKQPPKKKQA